MTRQQCVGPDRSQAGYGLVELLVVLGILGIVLASIQGLYLAHQRSATTETEAVDVQQNLRVAMDQMGRDIAMAGFLVKTAGNPVAVATNGASGAVDSMTLNTGSQALVGATINSATTDVVLAAGNFLNVAVMPFGSPVASIGGFEAAVDAGVSTARIANYRGQPLGNVTFAVTLVLPTTPSVAPFTCGSVAPPCMQLRANAAASGTLTRGDTILKTSVTGGAEAFPQTVAYSVAACPAPLAGNCLMRTTVPAPTGGATVVATNVTNLQFSYLLPGNVETAAPTAAQMSTIRAVRVTIQGQLVDTAAVAGGKLKTRTLTSVVAIRNT